MGYLCPNNLSSSGTWRPCPTSAGSQRRTCAEKLVYLLFDLRFFRPFRADLSIRKFSSFFPSLIAATSQRGLAPRPAQVSPDGPRYFGGTFLPLNALPPPRTSFGPPMTAILSNCC